MKRNILFFATLSAFSACSSAWSDQPVEATPQSDNGKVAVVSYATPVISNTAVQTSQITPADGSFALPAGKMALWQEETPPPPVVRLPLAEEPKAVGLPAGQPGMILPAATPLGIVTSTAGQPLVREFPPSAPLAGPQVAAEPPADIVTRPLPAQQFGPSSGPLAETMPNQTVQAVPAAPNFGPIQLPPADEKLIPIPEPQAVKPGESAGPFQILDKVEELDVIVHRSKLLRSQLDILRTAVVDPTICDLQQYTTREFGFIGKSVGTTQVTIWFRDRDQQRGAGIPPRTFVVHVKPDPDALGLRLRDLEAEIAKLFPNSKVHLRTFGTRILVLGQARDVSEAAEILLLIRGESIDENGRWTSGAPALDNGNGGSGGGGGRRRRDSFSLAGAAANNNDPNYDASNVINLLKVPGDHQVLLRVKIAELSRTAARSVGADFQANIAFNGGTLLLQSLLNASNNRTIIGNFDNNRLNFGIHYLEQHGVVRLLSEPTLVTLSGKPANFIAGGEFPVPTVVGLGGASAATTDFRAYGAIVSFTPYVLDKDLIRLNVNPEFSQIDAATGNNGVPGLTTRTLNTTVEMRAGQTLALGGLLDESMKSDQSYDIPWIGKLLGPRNVSRSETEIIILVTPELVHPMEPEEVPPLPGFDVTEPDNYKFILKADIEGVPTMDYRSTVWPQLQERYRAGGTPMIDGPFGHSNVWQNDQQGPGGPSGQPVGH